ncbi:MAG: hypothetical protein D6818_00930 [Bacteroidetes bacterium]|nr:MAG: hypothetical protein D6818_00930 [Bacteroidota bacterium]
MLALAGCRVDPPPAPAPTGFFETLEAGSTFHYALFTGENYYDPADTALTYHPDTLVWEVTAHPEAHVWEVREYLTEGSASKWGDGPAPWPDSVFTYRLRVAGDTLFAEALDPDGWLWSRLFQGHPLPLAPVTDNPATITGWKTDLSYCECDRMAHTDQWTLFGKIYYQLNLAILNGWMAVDGPGFTYVYSQQYGLLRSVSYSWWTQSGVGWDRFPAD